MTLTTELPGELADALSRRPDGANFARIAALRGIFQALQRPQPPMEAAPEVVSMSEEEAEEPTPRTGAEWVAHWKKHDLDWAPR